MFVINSENLQQKIKVSKRIAKYLIKNNIPLLSRDDSGFYFSQTKEYQTKIDSLPWYLKIL